VRGGQGERLPLLVHCRWCGDVGQLQVRPPMPTRSSTGWMMPSTAGQTGVPSTRRHGREESEFAGRRRLPCEDKLARPDRDRSLHCVVVVENTGKARAAMGFA
jgi:hypothetical protein